jgi:AraC family transcriptional regulator
LNELLEYVQTNLEYDVKLSDLCKVAGMSQYYFIRLFKQSLGITPHQYLTQQRIERAKELLKYQKISIAEISLRCGFTSQSPAILSMEIQLVLGGISSSNPSSMKVSR